VFIDDMTYFLTRAEYILDHEGAHSRRGSLFSYFDKVPPIALSLVGMEMEVNSSPQVLAY
jgi:hypothetical protein